jgi:hypothetical protein
MPLLEGTGGSNVLQSFSDAVAGRSQQTYHGMASMDSAATVSYILARDAGASFPLLKENDSGVSSFDIDFDMTINAPTIFAGIGYIDYQIAWRMTVPQASVGHFHFTIYHVDGVTETSIATADPFALASSVSASRTAKIKFDVTRKTFGIGTKLRLNCIAHITGGNTTQVFLGLSFDPSTAGSELKLNMPVVNME